MNKVKSTVNIVAKFFARAPIYSIVHIVSTFFFASKVYILESRCIFGAESLDQ